jgi:hypothetical protein
VEGVVYFVMRFGGRIFGGGLTLEASKDFVVGLGML